MKNRQVGFVLMALIAIGIIGIVIRLVTGGSSDFILKGLMPISGDVITKVIIMGPDQNSSELVKIDEENWEVGMHPVFAPRLNDFWVHVNDIPMAQLVAREKTHHEKLGVDDENSTKIDFYFGQSLQEQFHVGKWLPEVRLCYIRKSGNTEVYGIPCARNGVFSADPDTWRNPIIASIPASDVASLDFIYPDSTKNFSVGKTEEGDWVVASDTGIKPANLQVLDMILQTVQILPATGFETDEISKDLDFDAPDGSVRINTHKEASTPTTRLKFIKKNDDLYYVKIPSQSTTFTLDSQIAEFLLITQEIIEIVE